MSVGSDVGAGGGSSAPVAAWSPVRIGFRGVRLRCPPEANKLERSRVFVEVQSTCGGVVGWLAREEGKGEEKRCQMQISLR